jgi:hypothetical protein
MLTPLVRSVFSAVVAACFALNALTLGAMPGCATAASDPQSTSAHGHGSSQGHSHGGQLPGAGHCRLHLCCANVATPVVPILALGRMFAAQQIVGFVAAPLISDSRPAHLLPYAHAPPHASA